MMEEHFRKESLPAAVVLQVEEIKKCADFTLEGTVRIRHVIIGILPYADITKQNRDANSAKSAYSGNTEVERQPDRRN